MFLIFWIFVPMGLSSVNDSKYRVLTEKQLIGFGRSHFTKLSIEYFFASMFSIASYLGRNFLGISPKNNLFVLIPVGYNYQPKGPFRGIQPSCGAFRGFSHKTAKFPTVPFKPLVSVHLGSKIDFRIHSNIFITHCNS
jgi:hypothetical protein